MSLMVTDWLGQTDSTTLIPNPFYLIPNTGPCAGAQAGTYSVSLMVTDWLGQTDSNTWSFTKAAAALPLVQLVGGTQQTFTISQGISVPVQIFLQSVCAGAAQDLNIPYKSKNPMSAYSCGKE